MKPSLPLYVIHNGSNTRRRYVAAYDDGHETTLFLHRAQTFPSVASAKIHIEEWLSPKIEWVIQPIALVPFTEVKSGG